MKLLLVTFVTALVSSCTWVKVTDGGNTVRVLDPGSVSTCKVLGKITAISRAKVAGINRNATKLALELETIARNEAANMGGDTVTAVSEITGNEREFRAYQCE